MTVERGGYDRSQELVELQGLYVGPEERMNPAQKVERCAGRLSWLLREAGEWLLVIDVSTDENRREEVWRPEIVGASFVYRRVA